MTPEDEPLRLGSVQYANTRDHHCCITALPQNKFTALASKLAQKEGT